MDGSDAGEMEIVPVAWAVKEGILVPVEFFPVLGRRGSLTFGEGFVREFVGLWGSVWA